METKQNEKWKNALKIQGNFSHFDYLYNYLDGGTPLPDIFFIGNDCKRKHGKNGKTVRRTNGDNCLFCERFDAQKRRDKRNAKLPHYGKNHKKALDVLYDAEHNEPDFLI